MKLVFGLDKNRISYKKSTRNRLIFEFSEYKLWAQMEIIHHTDSEVTILDSGANFVGFM